MSGYEAECCCVEGEERVGEWMGWMGWVLREKRESGRLHTMGREHGGGGDAGSTRVAMTLLIIARIGDSPHAIPAVTMPDK